MTKPVRNAVRALRRDMDSVLSYTGEEGAEIRLQECVLEPERYTLAFRGNELLIAASDELGAIYGLYAVSKELLGVHEFWFWNDQDLKPVERIPVPPDYRIESHPFAVRYRGWFVNDEVLLSAWSVDGDASRPWEMVFESLLRCGGNMVIPGTDKNAHRNRALAAEMGLYVTHHHAEPLGAEMFARAYPDKNASYSENPELFHRLWSESIERQKNTRVIWNLGFRGQGDRPFWEDDPQYGTGQARGKLIGELIREQHDMVRLSLPGAVCCTNLYGESMELYRDGLLELPEGVIPIWADNGYGKMVSRRQGNHDPRVPALPGSPGGRHGIYYHVSFYDLQAANHITQLTNSGEFICRELRRVLDSGVREFWIINCSNVKPHAFYLDAIAQMWRTGALDIDSFRTEYADRYFGAGQANKIAECFRAYEDCALAYSPHEDGKAGEQFPNYGTRILATQWIRDAGKPAEGLLWACDAVTLEEQIYWYSSACGEAAERYQKFVERCEAVADDLDDHAAELLGDTMLLHGKLYALCYEGARLFGEGYRHFLKGEFKRAFYCVGRAAERYDAANRVMRSRERGKWGGFYANDCLTDVKQSAWVLRGLMSWLRTQEDGPHYYGWQRELLYSDEDRRVMLITNMENHLTDGELFLLMKQKWG